MTTMIKTIYDNDNNIIYYEGTKTVKKMGTGGHIFLSKKLIDKKVKIIYAKTI